MLSHPTCSCEMQTRLISQGLVKMLSCSSGLLIAMTQHCFLYTEDRMLRNLNRHITVVEGFGCPNYPRGYVVGGCLLLVGSPEANWS